MRTKSWIMQKQLNQFNSFVIFRDCLIINNAFLLIFFHSNIDLVRYNYDVIYFSSQHVLKLSSALRMICEYNLYALNCLQNNITMLSDSFHVRKLYKSKIKHVNVEFTLQKNMFETYRYHNFFQKNERDERKREHI